MQLAQQVVASWHLRLLAQAAPVPAVQVPVPLQLPGVSVLPVHALHAVAVLGLTQAPVPLQLVAPHTPAVGQVAVQHFPLLPMVPHTPLAQTALEEHMPPLASLHVPAPMPSQA